MLSPYRTFTIRELESQQCFNTFIHTSADRYGFGPIVVLLERVSFNKVDYIAVEVTIIQIIVNVNHTINNVILNSVILYSVLFSDTDDCSADPCASTGTCIDEVNDYLCVCASGYTGATCADDIDDCNPDPCVHGSCTDTGADSFSCDCDTGYEGDTCGLSEYYLLYRVIVFSAVLK